MKIAYAVTISLFAAGPVAAQQQIYTGPYGGPNYTPTNIPSYGLYAPRQAPAPTQPPSFNLPPLPQVPHVQSYVPAPYASPYYNQSR